MEGSEPSSLTEMPQANQNGDEYVHRLVQDENAKTILLNVPLETSSTALGNLNSYSFK